MEVFPLYGKKPAASTPPWFRQLFTDRDGMRFFRRRETGEEFPPEITEIFHPPIVVSWKKAPNPRPPGGGGEREDFPGP